MQSKTFTIQEGKEEGREKGLKKLDNNFCSICPLCSPVYDSFVLGFIECVSIPATAP